MKILWSGGLLLLWHLAFAASGPYISEMTSSVWMDRCQHRLFRTVEDRSLTSHDHVVLKRAFDQAAKILTDGKPIPLVIENTDGNNEIRKAFNSFSLESNILMDEFQPGFEIRDQFDKCIPSVSDIFSGQSALATQIESTKRFLLSRYVFTVHAYYELSLIHGSKINSSDLSNAFTNHVDTALADISNCPSNHWRFATKSFMSTVMNERRPRTCSDQEFKVLKQYLAHKFDRLQTTLQVGDNMIGDLDSIRRLRNRKPPTELLEMY